MIYLTKIRFQQDLLIVILSVFIIILTKNVLIEISLITQYINGKQNLKLSS